LTVLLLAGFVLALLASLGLATASLLAQREIEHATDARHDAAEELLRVERLRTAFALTSVANRGYLLTGEPELKERGDHHRAEFRELLATIRASSASETRAMVDAITARADEHNAAYARAMEMRRAGESRAAIAEFFSTDLSPRRALTQEAIAALDADRSRALDTAERSAARADARISQGLLSLSIVAVAAVSLSGLLVLRAHWRERATTNAWTRFLSIASHDLKTPLSTLSMRVQIMERLLASGSLDEARLRQELERLGKGVEQMSELVRSVLDLSRLRNGSLALDPRPVDLGKLVGAAAERMRDDFARAGVELTLAPASVTGSWDPLRIEQVVTNLLSNALKYGDKQPVEVRVEEEGDWALLSVTDHGRGIAAAEQPHVFKPFARVAQQSEPGHGLGLFIVGSIVEAHGGRVRLRSAPHAGSTFTVELPRRPGWAAAPA
jgi:K+-sensing histidine kinase KdpD